MWCFSWEYDVTPFTKMLLSPLLVTKLGSFIIYLIFIVRVLMIVRIFAKSRWRKWRRHLQNRHYFVSVYKSNLCTQSSTINVKCRVVN